MIIRIITYYAQPDKDVTSWVERHLSKAGDAPGVESVEFIRSISDPSQHGGIFRFRSREDLDRYKSSDAYRELLESTRAEWLDLSKPVQEQIFELLEA